MSSETISHLKKAFLSETVWGLSYLPRIRPEIRGKNNLELAKDHLKNQGSLFLAINHVNDLDLFSCLEILRQFGKISSQFVVGTAIKIIEGREKAKGLDIVEPIITGLSERKHFTLAPLVQTSDTVGRKLHQHDSRRLNERGLSILASALDQPQGVAVLFPEGTRAHGKLISAESGVDRIFLNESIHSRALFLPIAQEGNESIISKNRLHFAPPYSFSQAQAEIEFLPDRNLFLSEKSPLGDLAMIKIGSLLPQEHWGEYTQQISAYRDIYL